MKEVFGVGHNYIYEYRLCQLDKLAYFAIILFMKPIRRFFEGMGIWVALLPFLHFPVGVRNALYIFTGGTLYIAAYLYLRKRIAIAKDKVEPMFVEAKPTPNDVTPHTTPTQTIE